MHASHAQQLSPSPLRNHYQTIRDTTLELTRPFSAEDLMLQSMPDASPAKWHMAHTTWFFETFILSPRAGYRPFNPDFRRLFNSYYKRLGSHPVRSTRGLMSRPSLEDVRLFEDDEAYKEMAEIMHYPTSDALGDWLRRHGGPDGEAVARQRADQGFADEAGGAGDEHGPFHTRPRPSQ
jgi:hypothetical protein